MEQRILGNKGPSLSVIGLGSWAIGGPWLYGWGPVDDEESIRTIHDSLTLGVNWIDTAAAYGFGHSEEVVARAVEGMHPKPFVATKCGLVPDGRGGAMRCSRPESIRKEAEQSLRRLRTDCIDLYQIHWHDRNVPVEESWGEMLRLRDEGKVRYCGVSNYDVPLLRRCMAVGGVQSLQPPYSLIARTVEEETLSYCSENQIGVVAYSPMQSGLLSGRFDRGRLAADDWRLKTSLFQGAELSQALALVDDLRPIAATYGKTVGQLAVAWVLSHAAVTSAIVGARSTGQAEENVGSAGWAITPEDREKIEQIHRSHYGQ